MSSQSKSTGLSKKEKLYLHLQQQYMEIWRIIYIYDYYCVLRHFQHYFSHIVAVNFTVRGNRSTRRKQTTDLTQVTDKFNHGYWRAWRYQRGNQNPYIEEEQKTQWSKEKVQNDKHRSTKHTYKTKYRVTRTPLKTGGQLGYAPEG